MSEKRVVMKQAKSLYTSRVVTNVYGTEIEIWAVFGPIFITEKKKWSDYEGTSEVFFSWFRGQNKADMVFCYQNYSDLR